MNYYRGDYLDIGDRVAIDSPHMEPRLGTIRMISLGGAAKDGRSEYQIEWDDEPGRATSGWLRHALRKIPKPPQFPLPSQLRKDGD